MFSSDKLKKQRLLICSGCPNRKRNKVIGATCGTFLIPTKKTCGCILKSLVTIKSVKCKSGKW